LLFQSTIMPQLVRQRRCRYSSLEIVGQQRRENTEKLNCVDHPILCGPIRRMNLILHAGMMKATVGKAVNNSYIAALVAKPRFELFKTLRPTKLLTRNV